MPSDVTAFSVFVVAVPVPAVVLVFMGVKSVPRGHEDRAERLGCYTRTLAPGR